MHQSVANIQNKDKHANEEEVALSQRDMALTQAIVDALLEHKPHT